MIRFLKIVIVAPIAILVLVFAFANRQFVAISFDPFVTGDIPAFAIEAPLFVVLIAAVMIGVVLGGAAVWLAQAKHRHGERVNRAEAAKWRAEAETARGRALPPPGALAQR